MTKYSIKKSTLQGIKNAIGQSGGDSSNIQLKDYAQVIRDFEPSEPNRYINDAPTPRTWHSTSYPYEAWGLWIKEIPEGLAFLQNVTRFDYLFRGLKFIEKVPKVFLSPEATNFSATSMFEGCTNLKEIPQFDMSRITNMSSMFKGCSSLTSIPVLDTSSVTSMSAMFSGCSSLTTVPNLDTSSVTNMSSMFNGCSNITAIPEMNTELLTSVSGMFSGCKSLAEIPYINLSKVSSVSNMFKDCSSLASVPNLDFSNATDVSYLFSGCTGITEVGNIDFSKATNIQYAFSGCSGLKKVGNLDLNSTTASSLVFLKCPLEEVGDISMNNATTAVMQNVFGGTSNISYTTIRKIGSIRAEKATSAASCFSDFSNLTEIGEIYLPKVTNCSGMFYYCGISDMPVLTLGEVTNASSMFSRSNIKSIPNFDTSHIQNGRNMFSYCSNIEGAQTFDAASLTDGYELFRHCTSLEEITLLNIDNLITTTNIFAYTTNLKKITLYGNPANMAVSTNFLLNNSNEGVLYYDGRYDYSKIINVLPETWTAISTYTPTECVSLSITADDVSCRKTTTTIYYTAITNGINDITGERMEGIEVTGTVMSDPFEQNTSYDEVAIREISFTYMGVTATTTIEQSVWVDQYYTINLNDEWQLSSTVANPDASLYDGVYESFQSKGTNNSGDSMFITIEGYTDFKFYIRSYAESNYDYVMVSQLDKDITYDTSYSNTTLIKAHTRGNQNSGTAISNYQLVEFTGIDGGEHTIEIIYRKDSSQHSGNDRGYVLIPYE